MEDRKDYIDLREGTENEAVGNGPPPMPPLPVYMPPARKNNALIAVIIVLSAFLVLAVGASFVMGFMLYRGTTNNVHTATEIIRIDAIEFETGNWRQDIEAWARQVEIEAQEWARQAEIYAEAWANQIEIDAENWASNLEEFIVVWADGLVTQWGSQWSHFGNYSIWAAIVDDVDIVLGTSDVRVLTHNSLHLWLESSGSGIFQVRQDMAGSVVSVTDNQHNPGGTLTVYVPYSWSGRISLDTRGDVYISDSLPDGIILQWRQALAP